MFLPLCSFSLAVSLSICLSCLFIFLSVSLCSLVSLYVCVPVCGYVIICILCFALFFLYLSIFSVGRHVFCLLFSVFLPVYCRSVVLCILIVCFSSFPSISPLLSLLVYPLLIHSIFHCLPTTLFPSPHALRRVGGGLSGAAGVCWGATLFGTYIRLVYLRIASWVSVSPRSGWAWGRG